MLSILHARLRVQRAPGFPCALCFQKANVQAKLGRYPRSENVKLCPTVIARSEATKQSILILHLPHGLLRYARNDVVDQPVQMRAINCE